MIDLTSADKIRKPNEWNTYENPVDNLIHGIIIQAVADIHGYQDDDKRFITGDESIHYLETDGLKLFRYLLTRPRRNVSDAENRFRRYNATKRKGKLKYRKVM